jgi:hypothetical protein
MSGQDQADIEQRMEKGEWLRIGDLMTLFGQPEKPASRSSVDRWIRNGATFGKKRLVIRYKLEPSGDRICHPDDIAAVLAESRKVRSVDHPDGIPGQ